MAKLLVKTEGVENRVLELRLGANRLGRGPENHCQIDHPTVSSLHCEVVLSEDTMVVRDCNSTNGTYVNGQRVIEAALHAGETFQLGDVELVVETTEVTVAIPQIEHPLPAPPVMLPDGAMLCPRHPETRATHQCTQCHEVMCDACVHHLRRHGGKLFYLCPVCSGPCEPLGGKPPRKKPTLLDQLKQTVRVPFTRAKPGEE